MSIPEPLTVAEDVLGRTDADEVLVAVARQRAGLTRFAESFVHQHVGEDATTISLTVVRDGRVATATTTDLTSDGLGRLVARAQDLAEAAPVDADWPGVAGASQPTDPGHLGQSTVHALPEDRTRVVADFVRAGGENAAGYCDTEVSTVALASSAGLAVQQVATRATLDGIHRLPSGVAGGAHQTSIDLADLDGTEAGREAVRLARRGEPFVDLAPGRFEVVLGPEAVGTVAIFLSFYGFNAKSHHEGQSCVVLGQQQFDASLDLVDDPLGPTGLGVGFDGEGTPRATTPLVEGGVSSHLVHDRRTARKFGTVSTGHGGPGSSSWGPIAANLTIKPSDGTTSPLAELVGGMERGLVVTAFNYCRILDPKTLDVTGLTRNGTFLVEDGKVVGGVGNLRFTQSFAAALAPGQVLGIGDDARFADNEFGAGMTYVPSLRLASWNVTGDVRG